MVAEHWLCSERHVRNMIDRGELPSWRAGGKLIRIWGSDVEEYECRQQRGGSPNSEAGSPSHGTMTQESATVSRLEPLTRARLSSLRRPSMPR
jgi:excisionase family DNA binding protein